MKIIRTNLSPGMTVLLLILLLPLVFLAVAVLIVVGLLGLVFWAVTGNSPFSFFRQDKSRNRDRVFQGSSRRNDGRDFDSGAANDDTIECEVISARTVEQEPDTREIP